MTGSSAPRVASVVVAWNRADILRDTLDGLGGQTRPLDDVVVVDNASTDGTPALVAAHPAVTDVVTLPENLGGAGGFAAGIARAVARGADLVWIMDDDTVPSPTALQELLRVRAAYAGEPAVLAARADWVDGREHPMNRPRQRPGVSEGLRAHAAAVGAVQIRTASFVAILIDARAIRAEGLPVADYFLWNDDFEYTGRLLRQRVGLYVDAARVEHRTKVFGNSTADPGPRFVNEVRNKIWTFTRSRAFSVGERLLYGGRSLIRWAALIVRSGDRAALLGRLRQGIDEGARAPRPNTVVFEGTAVAADVRALEGGAAR